MLTTRQNTQSPLPSAGNISILLVSPHTDDLVSLRNILHHRDWSIAHCASTSDARQCLADSSHSIVVTERDLPDGTWKDILNASETQAQPPLVLVISRHADENLWAEVLNLGGYDVLLKPFDRSEVTRVVGMAWRCWFGAFRQSIRSKFLPQYA